MAIIVSRHGILGDITQEIALLRKLLADLEGIASGLAPSDAELRNAPIIDHWVEVTRSRPCLAGQIHGHPTLRGSFSVTSEVWAVAPELGWLRTYSRFYRLGRRFSDEPFQGW